MKVALFVVFNGPNDRTADDLVGMAAYWGFRAVEDVDQNECSLNRFTRNPTRPQDLYPARPATEVLYTVPAVTEGHFWSPFLFLWLIDCFVRGF